MTGVRRALAALALLLSAAAPAAGQGAVADMGRPFPRIVADIDQTDVSINSTFAGSRILVFGAIRDGTEATEVIITVAGPRRAATVRRASRVGPIWANTASATIAYAPVFYAVAGSAPLPEIATLADDLRFRISPVRAIQADGDKADFVEALIRIRAREGSYMELGDAVTVRDGALFRTTIPLPSNLSEGDYRVRIFLSEGGEVIAWNETSLAVRKVGLEQLLWNAAQDQPYLYAAASLAVAVLAGWLASAVFAGWRR